MLGITPRVIAVVEYCPILGYFHPSPMLFFEFVAGWTVGGCSLFAMMLPMADPSIKSKWMSAVAFLLPALWFAALVPRLHLLASFHPYISAQNSIGAAFAGLPLDPRVHLPSGYINIIGNNPNLWAESIIVDIITITAMVILHAHSLRDVVSASASKTAK